MIPPERSLDALRERVDRLERSQRRLRVVLLALAAIAFACAGATTSARFKHVVSHHLGVFGAGEEGEVVTLRRGRDGGEVVLRDGGGAVRVTLGVGGMVVHEAGGVR